MVETNDVREAFAHIDGVETETSGLADGIRVAVPDSAAGEFFKTIRVRGFNAQSKRLGETIVAHIEAEESRGLGDLFG